MQSGFLATPFKTRHAAVCLALVIGSMLVFRAPFLFYIGMSTDAYNNGINLPHYEFLASQGRQGAYLLVRLMDGLGIYGPHLQYLNALLGIIALSLAAFYLFRSLFAESWTLVFVGSVLFLAHPYQAEILTFRDAAPFYALASMLGCLGYYLSGQEKKYGALAGTALMTAGLMIYQSFVNFLAMAWLLEAFLLLALPISQDELPQRRRKLIRSACSVAAAMAAYLSLTKVLNLLQGTAAKGRATLIALEDVPNRAVEMLAVFEQLVSVDLIVPAPVTSLLVAVLACSAMALLLLRGSGPWRFFALPVFAFLALFCSVGLISAGKDFWPVPRTLVAVALIPAFAACILLKLVDSKLLRNGIFAITSIVLVSFIGIGTLVAVDQVRINKRDAFLATSVAARVALPPGTRLAVIGGPNNAYGLHTVRGDMNISAYWTNWSKVEAFSESLGYRIEAPSEQDWSRGTGYCASPEVETWPAMTSVSRLDGGLVVVCLSKPQ